MSNAQGLAQLAVKTAFLVPGLTYPLPTPYKEYVLAGAITTIVCYPLLLGIYNAVNAMEQRDTQPKALPPPPVTPLFPPSRDTKRVTPEASVVAPHVKREPRDITERRPDGTSAILRKEVVTLPDGREVDLPRAVTPPPDLFGFDFEEDVTPVTTSKLLSSEALLKALDVAAHVAIIGATGAGKSTLLRNLCYNAATRGNKVVILDPHATPDSWPRGITVLGGGRDYNKITEALDYIYNKMQSRYNDLALGKVKEQGHPAIYVIFDEWRAIVQNIPDAGKKLGALITEARKVNIKVVLGGHSPYLKGLGLEDSALRESLLLCFLRVKTNQRWAEIGEARYALPAPLPQGAFGNTSTNTSGTNTISTPESTEKEDAQSQNTDGMPNDDDARMIRDLIEKGWSYNRICTMLGGSKTTALQRIHRAIGVTKET